MYGVIGSREKAQNTIGKRDFTQNITGKRENGASPGHGRGHGKAAVFTGRIFLASKPRCHPASSEITGEGVVLRTVTLFLDWMISVIYLCQRAICVSYMLGNPSGPLRTLLQ